MHDDTVKLRAELNMMKYDLIKQLENKIQKNNEELSKREEKYQPPNTSKNNV